MKILSVLSKNHQLIINVTLITLFIILYILASNHQFNLLYYLYPKNQIPLYFIIIFTIVVAALLYYNTYIGILYAILFIFQLKWFKYDTFQNENPAISSSEVESKKDKLTTPFYLDPEDERFRMDDVKVREIIRQIQAELEFDPSKTPLSRKVIIDIYRKYFDNDIFVKLNEITQESEKYTSEYQSIYQNPTVELGYDVDTAKILESSTAFGVTPIVDKGIGRGLRSNSS